MMVKTAPMGSFEALLARTTGERAVTAFLRRHPHLLYRTLCPAGGHRRYVLPNFPIGPDFKTDFTLINAYSGVCKVIFVELEPVDAQRFTKAGNPGKRLAGAIKQLDDWREYFESHRDTVRASLVRWVDSKDVLKYSDGRTAGNFAGQRLAEPTTPLHDSYKVIIGRSTQESREATRFAGRFDRAHDIEIISYDRLLETVRRLDTMASR